MSGAQAGRRALGRALALAGALALGAAPAAAQTVAIEGATVYPVSAPKLENATVVIRDGRIAAVGTSVAVPAGAVRIDGRGLVVTPGLIHATTALGLGVGVSLLESSHDDHGEYTAIGGTDDTETEGEINAAHSVRDAIDPEAVAIPITRTGGVTTALTAPSGGLLAGQGVLIDLDGRSVAEMVIAAPGTQSIELGDGSRGAGGGSRAAALARLRRLLDAAKVYERRRADFEQNRIQPLGAPQEDLEALLPLVKGQTVAFVHAEKLSDIQNAIQIKRDYGLRLVLRGGGEAWKAARELAAAQIPVVLDAKSNIPTFDGIGRRWDNAKLLRDAGVTVIIAGNDDGGPGKVRFSAGHAVRNGMAWTDALAALTLEPARAFGIADRYGSLEAGKVANVVVWTGDPFEPATAVKHVFIRGREIPLTSRQTELRERYRTLPPKY